MGVAARSRPGPVILLAAALTAALSGIYLLWEPQTLDLSAQVFRADLWDEHGWVIYNDSWYSGHTVPGYSLLYPPLGAWLGPALLGVVCAVAAAIAFAAIAFRTYGERAWVGALWFGLAATVSLYGGRITFALGLALGLLAVLALQRRRPFWAAVAAVAAALASPVAGLFTALAAAAVLIASRLQPVATRSRLRLNRTAAAVLVAAVLATLALAVAFPISGFQPFTPRLVRLDPDRLRRLLRRAAGRGDDVARRDRPLPPRQHRRVRVRDAVRKQRGQVRGDLRRAGDGAGAVPAPAGRPAAARRAAALVAVGGDLLRRPGAPAETRRPRRPTTRRSSPSSRTSATAGRSGSRSRRRGAAGSRSTSPSTCRWRAAGCARWSPRTSTSSPTTPDRGRVREVAARSRRRLRRRARRAARLPRRGRGEAGGRQRPALPGRGLVERALGALEGRPGDEQGVRLDSVEPDGYALTVPGAGRYLIRMRYSPYLQIVSGEGCLEPQGEESTLLTVPDGAGLGARGGAGVADARRSVGPRADLRRPGLTGCRFRASGFHARSDRRPHAPLHRRDRGDRLGGDRRALRGRDPRCQGRARSRSRTTITRSSPSRASRSAGPTTTRSTSTAVAPGRRRATSSRIPRSGRSPPTATCGCCSAPAGPRRRISRRTPSSAGGTRRDEGIDAMHTFALRMLRQPKAIWPDAMMMLGDQLYADQPPKNVREMVAPPRGPRRRPRRGPRGLRGVHGRLSGHLDLSGRPLDALDAADAR